LTRNPARQKPFGERRQSSASERGAHPASQRPFVLSLSKDTYRREAQFVSLGANGIPASAVKKADALGHQQIIILGIFRYQDREA